ncbi:MAG: hypothetical protein E4H13_07635 [Calditrichales bacterium]|nr:MAG: hypothetical protein E4H13_07635 [Calditrichales bacterium]
MKTRAVICILFLVTGISLAQNGTLQNRNILHDGTRRTFALYIPADYNGAAMAFYVANQIPDRIASVAGVAAHLNYTVMDQYI